MLQFLVRRLVVALLVAATVMVLAFILSAPLGGYGFDVIVRSLRRIAAPAT